MKICRQFIPTAGLVAGFALTLLAVTDGRAELNTTRLSPAGRQGYQLLQTVCSRCHSLDRALTAIETEKAPLTGQPFHSKDLKQKLTKLYRNSSLTKEESKTILAFYQEVAVSHDVAGISEGGAVNGAVSNAMRR